MLFLTITFLASWVVVSCFVSEATLVVVDCSLVVDSLVVEVVVEEIVVLVVVVSVGFVDGLLQAVKINKLDNNTKYCFFIYIPPFMYLYYRTNWFKKRWPLKRFKKI